MAISRESLITILYGANALNPPSDLSDGELAYSNGSKKLFIGSGGDNTPEWVGAIVEDESVINWYGVSEENNKIATQKAILDLFPSGAISEIKVSDKISFGNSDGSAYVSIKSNENSSQDVIYILPLSSGTADQVLKVSSVSGSDVNLEWGTISGGSPGGSSTHVQFNNGGSFGGDVDLTFDGSNLQIGSQGDLRLADSDSSNYVALQAPSTVANNNIYTLPSSVGSSGQVLSISSVSGNDATLLWDDSVSSVNTLPGDVVLFHYQSSPPVSGIAPGSRWMDSSTGEEYVYVNDGNSNQWIQPTLNPLFGTISGATTVVTSSSYAATDSDYYIGVNYAGAVTITLPASPQTGRMIVVKDESGEAGYANKAITIVSDDVSDLIDNETSAILNINNGGVNFIYRSGWRII